MLTGKRNLKTTIDKKDKVTRLAKVKDKKYLRTFSISLKINCFSIYIFPKSNLS